MLDIARRVRALAPDAYLINFTNPAGMITEAMQSVLGDRVLGICDTPSGLGRRVAAALGVDGSAVRMDYVGLNHLGWMRAVHHEGRDLLPALLADDDLLGGLEEGMVFGREWLRDLGLIPNEYLYYYYFNRDAVRSIIDSGRTRGEFLSSSRPPSSNASPARTAPAPSTCGAAPSPAAAPATWPRPSPATPPAPRRRPAPATTATPGSRSPSWPPSPATNPPP